MKTKRTARLSARLTQEVRTERPQLDVFQVLFFHCALRGREELRSILRILYERFAVIDERQRDQPASGQPTADATEDDAVRQRSHRRTRRVNDWFISVREAQRLQPGGG